MISRTIATGFAAVPFAYGMVRAMETGNDFRPLWMAVAGFIGALAAIVIGRNRSRLEHALMTLALSTLAAAAMGLMLGATAGPGMPVVAAAFGVCWGIYVFLRRAAPLPRV
jgi:hypothetical protein